MRKASVSSSDTATWSVAALKEHFEALIQARLDHFNGHLNTLQTTTRDTLRALEERTSGQFNAASVAVSKAEAASEKRLDAVNEFRATLSDQQRTLMPRSEVEALMKATNDKIEVVFRGLTDKIEVFTKTTNDKLETLTTSLREIRSVTTGQTQGWSWAVGVIALVASVCAIVFQFLKR